jgi:hypothetical protein
LASNDDDSPRRVPQDAGPVGHCPGLPVATPDFLTECAGLPWDLSVTEASAVPDTGSAVHHLVTSTNVKKSLLSQQNQGQPWPAGPTGAISAPSAPAEAAIDAAIAASTLALRVGSS